MWYPNLPWNNLFLICKNERIRPTGFSAHGDETPFAFNSIAGEYIRNLIYIGVAHIRCSKLALGAKHVFGAWVHGTPCSQTLKVWYV